MYMGRRSWALIDPSAMALAFSDKTTLLITEGKTTDFCAPPLLKTLSVFVTDLPLSTTVSPGHLPFSH
jgi:hypothetical protein